ncbi:MAG: hypothetical protein Tsb009_09780 [Planctomycetaceae bacterium]
MLSIPVSALSAEEKESITDAKISPLSLVGQDAGLCIQLKDLNSIVASFRKSGVPDRFGATEVFKTWINSRDFQNLKRGLKQIETVVGQPLGPLASDLFGRNVILAAYPQPDREPAGVLILQAKKRSSLERAVQIWNQVSPKDIRQTIKYRGTDYVRRTGHKNKKHLYYVVLGDVFAMSDHEAMIQKIIQRAGVQKNSANHDKLQSLSNSSHYHRAMSQLTGNPSLTAYINPRPWDREFMKNGKTGSGQETFLTFWKNCRSIAIGLRLEGGIAAELVADFHKGNLPTAWKRFARRTSGSPDFLSHVPNSALIVFAGRYDPEWIAELIRLNSQGGKNTAIRQFRKHSRAVLMGLDLVDDLLPKLSENVGMYVVPRVTSDKNVVPFDGLTAIGINLSSPVFLARLDKAVTAGGTFLTTLYNLQLDEHQTAAVLKSEKRNGVVIRWVDRIGHYRPAVALSKNYILLASSPEMIEEFLSADKSSRLVSTPGFQKWRRDFFPTANQLVLLNVRGLRDHIRSVKPVVVHWLAKSGSVNESTASQRLERLLDLLAGIDNVFLAIHVGERQLRVGLGGIVQKRSAGQSEKSSGSLR